MALTDYINTAPTIIAFTFAISFLESLALVGLLLPGVALLFAISALAANITSFETLLIAGAIGSFLGDALSYHLGIAVKWKALKWPIVTKNQKFFDKSQSLCEKYGIFALLLGRFIGPLRPIMPLMAGILDFSKFKFYSTAVIGSIIWAPVYLAPGYYLGKRPEIASHHWGIILVVLLLPQFFIYIANQIRKYRFKKTILLISMTIFIGLSLSVALDVQNSACTSICTLNQTIYDGLQSLSFQQSDLFLKLVHIFTNTADTWIISLFGLLALYLSYKNKNLKLCGVIIAVYILPFALKYYFNIDRPPGDHSEITKSFPSGHSYFSFLIFMSYHLFIRFKHWITHFLGYWALLIALSRLVLGVHWFSDVLAGAILASISASLLHVYSFKPTNTLGQTDSTLPERAP